MEKINQLLDTAAKNYYYKNLSLTVINNEQTYISVLCILLILKVIRGHSLSNAAYNCLSILLYDIQDEHYKRQNFESDVVIARIRECFDYYKAYDKYSISKNLFMSNSKEIRILNSIMKQIGIIEEIKFNDTINEVVINLQTQINDSGIENDESLNGVYKDYHGVLFYFITDICKKFIEQYDNLHINIIDVSNVNYNNFNYDLLLKNDLSKDYGFMIWVDNNIISANINDTIQ